MLAPELWCEANANAKLVFRAGKIRTEELKEEKMSLLIPEVHVAPTPPLHPQTQTHPSVGQSMELPHANRSPFAAAGGGDGGGGRWGGEVGGWWMGLILSGNVVVLCGRHHGARQMTKESRSRAAVRPSWGGVNTVGKGGKEQICDVQGREEHLSVSVFEHFLVLAQLRASPTKLGSTQLRSQIKDTRTTNFNLSTTAELTSRTSSQLASFRRQKSND